MERLRAVGAHRPALPGPLLRRDIDTLRIPQLAVDARIVAKGDIPAADRRAGEQFGRQQTHRQTVGDQRQQSGRAQGQHQRGDQNT